MAVKTTRTQVNAKVHVDNTRCTACGLCSKVCSSVLYMENGCVRIKADNLFGCIGCAQCQMVCPEGCITVHGRTLSVSDDLPLPEQTKCADYENLHALMLSRRSVRRFQHKEVEKTKITKILDAAATAPMGIPPSDVSVLVLEGFDKVRGFSFDFIDFVAAKRWFLSKPMRVLLRPFIGKAYCEMFDDFVEPFLDFAIEGKKNQEDYILYGAPLAMVFQGSPYADPADAQIAATYAMLAAEALGLGTCMIGSVIPWLAYAGAFRAKYHLRPDLKNGLVVIFGYAEIEYLRGIRRTFAQVDYI